MPSPTPVAQRFRPSTVIAVSLAFVAAIFVGDLYLPAEVPAVPYAAFVLMALWLPWKNAALVYALCATVLLLASNAVAPPTQDLSVAGADVALSLAAIWACGALCYRYRRESESAAVDAELLRTVIREAVDPTILIDTKGAIVTINPAAERVFGYSSGEVVGNNVKVLMPAPDKDHHDQYLRDYLKTGVKKIIGIGREVTARRKDGSLFAVRLAMAEATAHGARYFVGTVQDLTEYKQRERALRESEARLRAVVESAVDPIIVIDELGEIESFNRAGEFVLGYSAPEVVGRNVRMLMPSPDREQHDGYLERYMRTGEKRVIGIGREVMAQRKDGTLVPVRLAIAEATAGTKRRFVGMLHDLTAQKEAQKRLLDERNFVAATLDTTDALVIVADRAGGIVRLNRSAEVELGYRTQDYIGRPLWPLIVEEQQGEFAQAVRAIRPGAPAVRGEHQFLTAADDRRTVEWAASGIWTSEGVMQFLVVTGIDTTLRHRAEDALFARDRELHEVQVQLYRASRLGDLGEMATAIAHELNQPLTAVLNYVQTSRELLMSGDASIQPRILEFMEKAGIQADRAGKIIRRLRQLYERGESEMISTDLNSLVRESIALALLGANEKGVKVDIDLAGELPNVSIDRVQIQQVVFNLVRNAVEALEKSPVRNLRIATRRVDNSIEVSVTDSGPGVSEEVAAKLFEPFMTTKPTGMGLGLSICRSIVESHGGKIGATSAHGAGANFTFSLPLDPEERTVDA